MKYFCSFLFLLFSGWVHAQVIPSNRVLSDEELAGLLKKEVITQSFEEAPITKKNLAAYFRDKFSERFYYDYHSFDSRISHYNHIYSNQDFHRKRALDHLNKYADSTHWLLPFDYLNGDPVNAYALRHLARQHKMVDIAFHYFNSGKDPDYIRYFGRQMQSLNDALESGTYEKIEDGNGVYEAFRSGYRVLNWLWIHNMFLNEKEYTDDDQLLTIATLLQHGQHLYERNDRFKSGNHQTRGVSALAVLAILFRDFEGTDLWFERAMRRLGEHLEKEINDDGFQFERSVHYHMSDINNYFYVYQLAKINDIKISKTWEENLRGLFTTLVKLGYPDRSAPVLQDDTEIPWAEKNDISGVLTLGYLLFEDPVYGYFASEQVEDRIYWFLSDRQVKLLTSIDRKRPEYGSLSFPSTHYYIMREGWKPKDKMMIISAGVDAKKPDHQHGDILGIQAMANGHAILPNYQVRYSLSDFELFKNSMVKNVALVDDELQGKQWTSNKGGSGFGKFLKLPSPEVIAWETNSNFDFFAGRHNGFEHKGVRYTRQVIFVKNDFWIVKDNFQSDDQHDYKQVWQGHYTSEKGANLLRATAPDASGLDLIQLYPADSVVSSGARGKQWSVVNKFNQKKFSFLTIVYPFRGYNNRFIEHDEKASINGWEINQSKGTQVGEKAISLSSKKGSYFFNVKQLKNQYFDLVASEEMDLYVEISKNKLLIQSISCHRQTISLQIGKDKEQKIRTIDPGEVWSLDW